MASHAVLVVPRQAKGVQNILVTMGKDGAFVLTEKGDVVRGGSTKVDKVVDTTGAGDCFRAAFTVALVAGRPIEDALTFAAHSAGLCIQQKGAMPSMPAADAVEASFNARM